MNIAPLASLVFVLFPSIPACSAQSIETYHIVSHCDFYQAPRTLSDVLAAGDVAFLASQLPEEETKVLGHARFSVTMTYFGKVPEEVALLRGSPSDPVSAAEYILSRYDSHVGPAFFWNYASKPNAYGYSGADSSNCDLIPVSLPEQSYIVVMEAGRITMFEPVPKGDSPLKDWFEFYANEVLPFTAK